MKIDIILTDNQIKELNDIANKESDTEKYIKSMSKIKPGQLQEPYNI
jgi:hypothetical protein